MSVDVSGCWWSCCGSFGVVLAVSELRPPASDDVIGDAVTVGHQHGRHDVAAEGGLSVQVVQGQRRINSVRPLQSPSRWGGRLTSW